MLRVALCALALAGCALVPPAASPNQTALTYLTLAPPAAALDAVVAWVPEAEALEVERTSEAVVLRDLGPGQDNVARVQARTRPDGLTEVTVRSRYVLRRWSGFRDLATAVYHGQRDTALDPVALPVHDGPPCTDLASWRAEWPRRSLQTAQPDTLDIDETPPVLIGGLEDLQRRTVYPESVRRAGGEGQVMTEFVVDTSGAVACAQVIASPHPALTEAVLASVRASRFTPGTQEGRPVRVRFSLPMTFRLR